VANRVAEPCVTYRMSTTFDEYAESYEEACHQGLALTGESRDFFAKERVRISSQLFRERLSKIERALDFGCGLGHTTPHFLSEFPKARIIGLDNSHESIDRAGELYHDQRLQFVTQLCAADRGSCDVAYCNGVFHHIPPGERLKEARLIFEALRPGGVFAFWENNPWNPGTRLVMSRIPFDRDAILLSTFGARRLLKEAGFQIVETRFHFFFPSMLRWMRRTEPSLVRLPVGGQYCVISTKNAE
jgi:SAM-dependent methyltransferase